MSGHRTWHSRLAPLGPLGVLLTAGGLLWASAQRPIEQPEAAPLVHQVAVDNTALVCPSTQAVQAPSSATGLTTVVTANGRGGGSWRTTTLDGTKDVARLGSSGQGPPGQWVSTLLPAEQTASALVRGSGNLAAHLHAYTATVATKGVGGGLAVTACTPVTQDVWFLGPGSTVDHADTILLANPSGSAAVADVSLLTSSGLLQPVGSQGIVVDGGQQIAFDVAHFAAGRGDLAVHVRSSQGEVAVAVLDRWQRTLAPAGTEWVPDAGAPARRAEVLGVPVAPGRRQLLVANPGDRTATVAVQIVGPTGSFPAAGLGDVTVPAASVTTVAVPDTLSKQAFGLRLVADVPVLSVVRATSAGARPDVGYATAPAPLTGPAVVPVDLPSASAGAPMLALVSADPITSGSVRVDAFAAAGGSLGSVRVDVPAGRQVEVDSGHLAGGIAVSDIAYLVLTPTSGSVEASAAYSSGSLQSVLPLVSTPTTVTLPAVSPRG